MVRRSSRRSRDALVAEPQWEAEPLWHHKVGEAEVEPDQVVVEAGYTHFLTDTPGAQLADTVVAAAGAVQGCMDC